jgi:hypothetical protein
MNRNPNCGGSHCTSASGEVRLLPTGKHGSHNTFCRQCYEHEMDWRKQENQRLAKEFQWVIPEWETLEIWQP